MASIEKGLDVPPLPADFFSMPRKVRPTPADMLRRGIGLAYLISYFVERRPVG